jgi:hypothetical protein
VALASVTGCASGGGGRPGVADLGIRPDAGDDGGSPEGGPGDGAVPEDDAEPPKDDLGVDLGLCDDTDGDGFPRGDGCGAPRDCDDGDPAIRPDADEVCNAVDDDCDGSVDEGFGGTVTCGVGACLRTAPECDGGRTDTCMPGTPTTEICNGVDDDCDGMVDEDFGGAVTCGVGACLRTVSACVGGMTGTCTPGAPAAEVCNGIDDDCDGLVDEDLPALNCGVGACRRTVASCFGGAPQTCVPGMPGVEACNGIDDDCDGMVDEDLPPFSCGVGACARTVVACIGGVTQMCTPGAPATETCNGVDDDCDGMVDEDLAPRSCGVGACLRTVPGCVGGMVPTCTPGAPATEVCNGIDDNCDGMVDEGGVCAVAPANDTCAGAVTLSAAGGTTTGTLRDATAQVTDCGATGATGVEVFYRVDLSSRSVVYLDTFGTAFDTSLSYRGASCPGAASPCEDDDCGVLQDQLVVALPAGTHFFAVHTRNSSTTRGPFNLRWQVVPIPSGGPATRIPGNGSYSGATSGASTSATSCTAATGPEATYFFTVCPSVTRTMAADTCTSSYDTVLEVRGPVVASSPRCNDDACSTGNWLGSSLSASVTGPGVGVAVVDGYNGAGSFTLAVSGL